MASNRPEATARKKKMFLAAYRETGTIGSAAVKAGIHRRSYLRWLQSDPKFRVAFEQAEVDAIENLVSEARRRALKGTNKPVFYQGVQCGKIREYSDTLLIFLLKGFMPERFRETRTFESDAELTRLIAERLAAMAAQGKANPPGPANGTVTASEVLPAPSPPPSTDVP